VTTPIATPAITLLPHLAPLAPDTMRVAVFAITAVVYLGMFLGGLPKLRLDRSGVALLGAIAMIAVTGMTLPQAAAAVDLPTIVLLFAFMVVSAQMRLGGFYTAVTRGVGNLPLGWRGLLAVMLLVAAVLSAVFSNDVICLAMTPVVARICLARRIDPLPFLIGLACAANIGSAATLIGNPQNMLIGSMLELPFASYLEAAGLPVVASLAVLWLWLALVPHTAAVKAAEQAAVPASVPVSAAGSSDAAAPSASRTADAARPAASASDAASPSATVTGDAAGTAASAAVPAASTLQPTDDDSPPFDPIQSAKGLAVSAALLVIFLFSDWPREVSALVGAAILLLSRRLHSSHVMGYVDWQLLLLFIGLFIVNHGFQSTGLPTQVVAWLAAQGVQLAQPGVLLVVGAALSNLVSNVPAVMLLLPHLPPGPAGHDAGVLLALASTFAGNLLLVGSIANLIVVDLAEKAGIAIDWKRHAAVGVPVTLLSLAVLWACWV
jgi:Na+/H+ antiporter NhaD/arsenite permease-like protein